jgi:hypothetical protein
MSSNNITLFSRISEKVRKWRFSQSLSLLITLTTLFSPSLEQLLLPTKSQEINRIEDRNKTTSQPHNIFHINIQVNITTEKNEIH